MNWYSGWKIRLVDRSILRHNYHEKDWSARVHHRDPLRKTIAADDRISRSIYWFDTDRDEKLTNQNPCRKSLNDQDRI